MCPFQKNSQINLVNFSSPEEHKVTVSQAVVSSVTKLELDTPGYQNDGHQGCLLPRRRLLSFLHSLQGVRVSHLSESAKKQLVFSQISSLKHLLTSLWYGAQRRRLKHTTRMERRVRQWTEEWFKLSWDCAFQLQSLFFFFFFDSSKNNQVARNSIQDSKHQKATPSASHPANFWLPRQVTSPFTAGLTWDSLGKSRRRFSLKPLAP